jgi:hypothetical protein
MTEEVYIVVEDRLDERTRMLRVFDNRPAANRYVDDPDNAGHLAVEHESVESSYDGR